MYTLGTLGVGVFLISKVFDKKKGRNFKVLNIFV